MFLHPFWLAPVIAEVTRLGQGLSLYATVGPAEFASSVEGLALDAEVSPVDLRSVVEGLALTADAGGVSFATRIL